MGSAKEFAVWVGGRGFAPEARLEILTLTLSQFTDHILQSYKSLSGIQGKDTQKLLNLFIQVGAICHPCPFIPRGVLASLLRRAQFRAGGYPSSPFGARSSELEAKS